MLDIELDILVIQLEENRTVTVEEPGFILLQVTHSLWVCSTSISCKAVVN